MTLVSSDEEVVRSLLVVYDAGPKGCQPGKSTLTAEMVPL